MIQDNELVNLLSGLAAILVLIFIAQRVEKEKVHLFYWAFFAMLSAYAATILEGFFWHNFFNLTEHLSLALAGILFALGCWYLGHNGNTDANRE